MDVMNLNRYGGGFGDGEGGCHSLTWVENVKWSVVALLGPD